MFGLVVHLLRLISGEDLKATNENNEEDSTANVAALVSSVAPGTKVTVEKPKKDVIDVSTTKEALASNDTNAEPLFGISETFTVPSEKVEKDVVGQSTNPDSVVLKANAEPSSVQQPAYDVYKTVPFPEVRRRKSIRQTNIDIFGDLRLFIKTISGSLFPLYAEKSDTVSDIMDEIYCAHNIQPHNQRLTYAGKRLDKERTISEYNIPNNAIIHLTLQNH